MVRAAFRVTGLHRNDIVSGLHNMAEGTDEAEEVAINRLRKLRFRQGSEVWIGGCPKFAATSKSGLTNPRGKAGTKQPEHRRWRVASAFPRSWSRALSWGR